MNPARTSPALRSIRNPGGRGGSDVDPAASAEIGHPVHPFDLDLRLAAELHNLARQPRICIARDKYPRGQSLLHSFRRLLGADLPGHGDSSLSRRRTIPILIGTLRYSITCCQGVSSRTALADKRIPRGLSYTVNFRFGASPLTCEPPVGSCISCKTAHPRGELVRLANGCIENSLRQPPGRSGRSVRPAGPGRLPRNRVKRYPRMCAASDAPGRKVRRIRIRPLRLQALLPIAARLLPDRRSECSGNGPCPCPPESACR